MAIKKITRKIINKQVISNKDAIKETAKAVVSESVIEQPVKAEEPVEEISEKSANFKTKKACFFCTSKTSPSYIDIATLKRFISDRSKITPRAKTGLCSKHQRATTRNIKYARHLSLLAFTPKV